MIETSTRYEPQPSWAKAMFVALVVLGIIIVLPWALMWSTCMPFMTGMRDMTAPGMMR